MAARRTTALMALAGLGLAIAGYLALYQLGGVPHVWDPVFGRRSSRTVLALTDPVPDAVAGVLAYATELALLVAGTRPRLRAAPWPRIALGVVLSAGALVSIALIVVQPAVAGSWCALCLASAGVSFALFALGIDEVRGALAALRSGDPDAAGHGQQR